MYLNEFMRRHKGEGSVSLQQLSDAGINPFAMQLLIESYTNRPEGRMTPLDFDICGVHVRIETLTEHQIRAGMNRHLVFAWHDMNEVPEIPKDESWVELLYEVEEGKRDKKVGIFHKDGHSVAGATAWSYIPCRDCTPAVDMAAAFTLDEIRTIRAACEEAKYSTGGEQYTSLAAITEKMTEFNRMIERIFEPASSVPKTESSGRD